MSRNKREGFYIGKRKIYDGIQARHQRGDEDISLKTFNKQTEEVECRGCDEWGAPNFDGNRYYCGGSPRCCP